ncbi:lysosomal-associated transmembrane protein 4A-like [Mya arenaria]|uniref:lysosomal-associated transmembrane protein 4A-like n=1 Tax=Mya arenaria TaxID=6604 RepID=UPI0022E677EA|nr:lysosomal-associated transmembrane protein 4A-like [Mya arenaria]
MRLKQAALENDRAFRCCFCCHVRVGTVAFGCLQLFALITLLTCMAISLTGSGWNSLDGAPKVLESNDSSTASDMDSFYYQWDQLKTSKSGCLLFALLFSLFIISLMMVYGAIRNRPCYLLPFFFYQVFDFMIGCLSFVSFLTYAPNVKIMLLERGLADEPFFNRLMFMDEQKLQILFVLIYILFLSVKLYLINMVWLCYRYLQLRIINGRAVHEYTTEPDSEMLLPPKYDEAMKMAPAGPPPPAYTA